MSLEPIDKKLINNRFSTETIVLRDIKDIIFQLTKVEAGVKLSPPSKLVLKVDNASAASEISLVSDRVVLNINNYLDSIAMPRIEKLIIKQI